MDYLELRELYHSQFIDDELYHHGIKGQRWGIRRFQNRDGSLTPEGKRRYGYDERTGKMSKEGQLLYEQDRKKSRNKKIAVAVGATAAAAAVTAAVIAKKQNVKVSKLEADYKNKQDILFDKIKYEVRSESDYNFYRNHPSVSANTKELHRQFLTDARVKRSIASSNSAKAYNAYLDAKGAASDIKRASKALAAIGTVAVGSLVAAKENKAIKKDKEKYS